MNYNMNLHMIHRHEHMKQLLCLARYAASFPLEIRPANTICKCRHGVGAVHSCIVMYVQGVKHRAQDTTLWSPSV